MTLVLVVDDEAVLVELLHDSLTDMGYAVVTAHNGDEALKVLAEATPDVIISDIMMPVMDGYTLLRTVRQRAIVAKIILTSAGGLRRDVMPQPDAFVPKPYDLDRLETLVAQFSNA